MSDALSIPASLTDSRSFRARLDDACTAAARSGTPFTLLAIGVDGVGGEGGAGDPPAGEAVMEAVGRAIAGVVRGTDSVARAEGGEARFEVLLQAAGVLIAVAVAERVLAAVRAVAVEAEAGPVRVVASAGLASTEEGFADADWLRDRASAALRSARDAGGNRAGLLERDPAPSPDAPG